jgi:BlaI family penicillinase repressor
MNSPTPKELTPAEWLVMQAVWQRASVEPEVTAGEILPEVAKRRPWHFSTLKTTMDRLVRKGYLASRIRGNTCFYGPSISREQATRASVDSFLDRVLDGAFGPVVAYLADRKGLTPREIEELERILEQKRKERAS